MCSTLFGTKNSTPSCADSKSSDSQDSGATFIRTFTFSPELPIVESGQNIPFPIATQFTKDCEIIYDETKNVLVVGPGNWFVQYILKPSIGAQVTWLVNGKALEAKNDYLFTQQIQSSEILPMENYFTFRTNFSKNELSLTNTGTSLITLGDIPNTREGDTSLLTRVSILKLSS